MKRIPFAVAALIAVVFLTAAFSLAKDKDKDEKWTKLGTRTVDFKVDHDEIEVGKSEGRFTAIRLKVEDGDLIMEKVKITFGNGEHFSPDTRLEFKEGSRSREIDLPGEARIIKKVEFVYKSEKPRDRALIELWGKEK